MSISKTMRYGIIFDFLWEWGITQSFDFQCVWGVQTIFLSKITILQYKIAHEKNTENIDFQLVDRMKGRERKGCDGQDLT